MTCRPHLLIAIFLLVLTLPASAQTRFFAPNQDGHSAILQTGISRSDINLAGGYSHIWNGRLELGLLKMGPADNHRSHESRQVEELQDETLPY